MNKVLQIRCFGLGSCGKASLEGRRREQCGLLRWVTVTMGARDVIPGL